MISNAVSYSDNHYWNSPDQLLLSRIRELASHKPLPVVLFSGEDNREVIHRAVRAGVTAYIVDGLEQHRLGTILDVAVTRFHKTDRLHRYGVVAHVGSIG